jgi:hypothetical protein
MPALALLDRERTVALMVWLVISWLWVGVPLAWGVYNTGKQASDLFKTAPAVPAKVAPK